jgi:hypothetical protein
MTSPTALPRTTAGIAISISRLSSATKVTPPALLMVSAQWTRLRSASAEIVDSGLAELHFITVETQNG